MERISKRYAKDENQSERCNSSRQSFSIFYYASVIKQKGESQNGGNQKAKHAKFSEKRTFFTSCSFFGKFGVLWFLVTSVLRFAFWPYYRRTDYLTLLTIDVVLASSLLILSGYRLGSLFLFPKLKFFQRWNYLNSVSHAFKKLDVFSKMTNLSQANIYCLQ